MSLHKSLVTKSGLTKHRNVLSRAERIKALQDEGRWQEDRSVFGLPKVASRKMKKKAKVKEAKVEGEAAAGAAAPAAAPAAGKASAAGKAPAAGKAAKPEGKAAKSEGKGAGKK